MNSNLRVFKLLRQTRNLAAILTLGTALSLQAGNANPGVLPPQSHPHGQTYGEWAAAFWQWILSIPADRSPLTDTTGEFAGENQEGSVWFLAGTFGDSAERYSTIPAGKSLFVVVNTWIFGSGAFDCHPSVPGVVCDVDSLRASATAAIDAVQVAQVWIDGVPVENIWDYRASTPAPFEITYPENSVTGLPAGTYSPQVADGIWLMLRPLKPGNHTITIHIESAIATPSSHTIVHHLTVK